MVGSICDTHRSLSPVLSETDVVFRPFSQDFGGGGCLVGDVVCECGPQHVGRMGGGQRQPGGREWVGSRGSPSRRSVGLISHCSGGRWGPIACWMGQSGPERPGRGPSSVLVGKGSRQASTRCEGPSSASVTVWGRGGIFRGIGAASDPAAPYPITHNM